MDEIIEYLEKKAIKACMDEIIEYLEKKIKACDELGGMELEKFAFVVTLKEVRKIAMNYTPCCKRDSEQLHTEVFKLANELALNGYGNEAVKMHEICNGM